MSSKYNNITNVLINKDILLTNKIRKQLESLFDNSESYMNFVEIFTKEKDLFLNNIQYVLDTNKKFEQLKHISINTPLYCFRYKKKLSKQNNKNIRCIFFIYEEKIILLNIFVENNSSAYKKAIENAILTYKDIIKKGD